MLMLSVAVCLAGCGHDDTFRVKGELDDGASINLRFIYYPGGTSVASGLTASTGGKFMYEGRASSPSLVEVYDNEYRLLGRFVAGNGDDIELLINRKNPYLTKAAGNDFSRRLSEFYNSNADKLLSGGQAERNGLVAKFVESNSSDPLADLLLVTDFDASGGFQTLADSLHSLITADARFGSVSAPVAGMLARVASESSCGAVGPVPYRVSGNRAEEFSPRRRGLAMLVFSDGHRGRDSVVDALRRLARHESAGRFEIYDLSMAADTAAWRRDVATDSATWKQGWVPGGVAGRGVDRLGIPTLPYFILTDTAGHQLWRGSSATLAVSEAVRHLAGKD